MNKYFFKYLLLALMSIFFVACAGGSMNQSALSNNSNSLPKWVLNPKMSNSIYYYAVGEGINKKDAKDNALSQISTEISVTITSNTTTKKISANNTYNKNIENITKSSSEEIKFTGVKVIENAYINNTFYSYVRVDKSILFQAQKKAMTLNYNNAIKLWDKVNKSSAFEIFKENKNINTNINNVMANLPILKSINNDFNESKYSKKMQAIKLASQKKKESAIVYIKTKNAFNEKNVIEKSISDYGIKITKNKNNIRNKKNLIIINLDKKAKKSINHYKSRKMMNVKFVDIRLTLVTYDGTGKVKLGKNIINLRNASRDSYDDARMKTKKLEREIKKQGILNILLENISS